MCDDYKNIYSKVQTNTQHKKMDLKTQFQDVEQKVILDNIKCDEHQTKMTCLFCRTCDHLVCPDCISFAHKAHNCEPVEKIISEKIDELKGAKAKYCEDLTFCLAKVEEIQVCEANCESLFDEPVTTKIKEKEKTLIDATSKYSNKLQNEVNLERNTVKKMFSDIKIQTDQTEKTIIHHQEEIRAALKSIKGSTILATASKFKKKMSDLNFNPIPSEIKHFIPKKETVNDISNLFGSLHEMKIPQVESDIDFEVVNSYTTDLRLITTILCVDDNSAWIDYFPDEVIKQINIDNDNVTTTNEVSCQVFDMTLTSNNDILLSLSNSSDIKLLTKSGEIKPFLSVFPLRPWGIHVTCDNEIIVGVKEPGDPYTPTDNSTRALFIFSMDGEQQHTHQYDSNKHRLFTGPWRIATTNNKDIVVADRTTGYTGRVVGLGRDGSFKWTYTVDSKRYFTTEFDPSDLLTTKAGHIIVLDSKSLALHILSAQGDLLIFKHMKDLGIYSPSSVALDPRGRLWVGGSSGGKPTGAKIHIVKLLW